LNPDDMKKDAVPVLEQRPFFLGWLVLWVVSCPFGVARAVSANPRGFAKGAWGFGLRAGAGALPLYPTRALPWTREGPLALSTPFFASGVS